ncbi:hypothetical protein R1flu_002402 [Riccia fluitans]|uniref:Uncharacterized protein n=1 Tax=Riccia fluitans TaxID=41844 RepID=A0ABD1Y610_9MARC
MRERQHGQDLDESRRSQRTGIRSWTVTPSRRTRIGVPPQLKREVTDPVFKIVTDSPVTRAAPSDFSRPSDPPSALSHQASTERSRAGALTGISPTYDNTEGIEAAIPLSDVVNPRLNAIGHPIWPYTPSLSRLSIVLGISDRVVTVYSYNL